MCHTGSYPPVSWTPYTTRLWNAQKATLAFHWPLIPGLPRAWHVEVTSTHCSDGWMVAWVWPSTCPGVIILNRMRTETEHRRCEGKGTQFYATRRRRSSSAISLVRGHPVSECPCSHHGSSFLSIPAQLCHLLSHQLSGWDDNFIHQKNTGLVWVSA